MKTVKIEEHKAVIVLDFNADKERPSVAEYITADLYIGKDYHIKITDMSPGMSGSYALSLILDTAGYILGREYLQLGD